MTQERHGYDIYMSKEKIAKVGRRAIIIDDKLWSEIEVESKNRGLSNASSFIRLVLIEHLKAKNGRS